MKRLRNKRNGRFISDRRMIKWFMTSVGVGTIMMLSFVGVNNLLKIGREILFVRDTYADVTKLEVVEKIEPNIIEKIKIKAQKYGVSAKVMIKVIECESQFRNIQSEIKKNGQRENSWGIAQIHLPSHPEITKEEALSEDFSISFLAKEIKAGNVWKWKGYNSKTGDCSYR